MVDQLQYKAYCDGHFQVGYTDARPPHQPKRIPHQLKKSMCSQAALRMQNSIEVGQNLVIYNARTGHYLDHLGWLVKPTPREDDCLRGGRSQSSAVPDRRGG